MAKPFTWKWNGDEFNRQLWNATATGLKRAAILLHTKARLLVDIVNPPPRTTPSKPGEPPRKRTGIGQSNIMWEANDSKLRPAVRIGVTVRGLYMAFLELGTARVKARPWLLRALKENWTMIRKLAATGGKNKIGKR